MVPDLYGITGVKLDLTVKETCSAVGIVLKSNLNMFVSSSN